MQLNNAIQRVQSSAAVRTPAAADLRKMAEQRFGQAFIQQNPGKTIADVGLRGRMYVDGKSRRMLTPAEVAVRKADGTLNDTPYLSWFQEDEGKLSVANKGQFDRVHQALLSQDLSKLVGA